MGRSGPEARRRRLLACGLVLAGLLLAGATMSNRTHHRIGASAAEATGPSSTTTSSDPATTTLPAAPTTTPAPPTSVARGSSPTPAATTSPAGKPSLPTGNGTPTSAGTQPKGNCGGTVLMKPEGVAWQCTFDDEFNGTSVDTSLWRIQETSWNGFHSGSECFENSPNNVSVAGGVLRLTTRKEAQGFLCQRPSEPAYSTPYTSGMLTTYGKFTQAYGRWEIRAKFPSTTVKGVQSSFWLWPQDPHRYGSLWPQSGEIDMAEFYSQYPDRVIPYVHYVGSTYRVTNNNCMVPDPTAWHTYLMVWTREFISMTIDGQPCLYTQVNPTPPLVAPAPFDQPFMLSLTQALGIQTNAFDENSTPLPATTTIDYVRVWK